MNVLSHPIKYLYTELYHLRFMKWYKTRKKKNNKITKKEKKKEQK